MRSGLYPWRDSGGARWGFLLLVLATSAGPAVAQILAGSSTPLARPTGAVYDGRGNLYFSETNRHRVRRLDPSGTVSTIAGTGVQGFAGDGGPAIAALLDAPGALAVDPAGDVYVADEHNQRVRRVNATSGVISTVAGNGQRGFGGDGGEAVEARLSGPSALAVDPAGNLYIADVGNHRVRRVRASDGTIATVAGDGVEGFLGDGGLAVSASVAAPSGLAIDPAGNLYLADAESHRVRMVRAGTGIITTIAGTGVAGAGGLARPGGLAADGAGNVFVADGNNQRVRLLSGGGMTTVAGDGVEGFAGDGGLAVDASFDTPRGVTLSGAGLLTIADTANGRMRQVAADRTVSTLVGAGATLPPDFTLAVAGASQQTVAAGASAAFPFAVRMEGGALGSTIALTAGALPAGVTVSFSPATLPGSGGGSSFTLTVQTATTLAGWSGGAVAGGMLAMLLPWVRMRRAAAGSMTLLALMGCGFQATKISGALPAAKAYAVTVSGTAKAPSGAMLVHTATVTVNVQ